MPSVLPAWTLACELDGIEDETKVQAILHRIEQLERRGALTRCSREVLLRDDLRDGDQRQGAHRLPEASSSEDGRKGAGEIEPKDETERACSSKSGETCRVIQVGEMGA